MNPWGSHPFGFDAWSADDYKAIFTQLAKMRMNFLGIHCYPEGHPYAEPTVWHGLAGDFDAQGRVKASYRVALLQHAAHAGVGRLPAKKDRRLQFRRGAVVRARRLGAAGDARALSAAATPEDCNDVFNRMAAQFKDAFTFARQLGVKTCLGTEAPLMLPKTLAAAHQRCPRAIYEGTFRRIMASHPLDYYWIWTPEGWTWEGNKPAQYSDTVADIQLAIEALKNVERALPSSPPPAGCSARSTTAPRSTTICRRTSR